MEEMEMSSVNPKAQDSHTSKPEPVWQYRRETNEIRSTRGTCNQEYFVQPTVSDVFSRLRKPRSSNEHFKMCARSPQYKFLEVNPSVFDDELSECRISRETAL